MPSPYSIPAPYSSPYGESIADLMVRQGDIAGQRAGAGGAIWGQALSNLGQIVGGAIEKHQEKKEQSKRDEALSALIGSDVWTTDPQAAFAASAKILGPREGPKFAEGMFGAMKLRQAQSPEEARQSLPMMARGLAAAPTTMKPQLYGAARTLMVNAGLVKPEEMPEQWSDDMLPLVKALAGEKAEHQMPQSVEQQIAAATLAGDQATVEKLLRVKREVGAAARAPVEPPKPEKTLAEKVTEASALAEARAKVEQKYSTAKESKEQEKKATQFATAIPVVKAVSELSARINTLQGVVAKASGEVEKAKAKVNLSDDVAEYEALIMGFTPLVARALGHTGVLTEQDVASVRMLFPRPEDSKSVRDRKVARLQSIMSQMPGMEAGAFGGSLETAAGGGEWQTLPGGIRIREKR